MYHLNNNPLDKMRYRLGKFSIFANGHRWIYVSKNDAGMKCFNTHLFLILVLVLSSSCSYQDQSTLSQVRALDLHLYDGGIETYYPEGFKGRAEANVNLLNNAIGFFQDNFGVKQSFSIAILDSVSWAKITSIPYGLPFVSGPPYIICIPANSENILSNTIMTAIDRYNLNVQYGITNEEIVNLFISLIGFHELGHIYASAYGASFPNKWTYEFSATYFAYFYLDQNFQKERDIWVDVSEILVEEINPRYTTLEDFEEMYVRVGVENYAWYQVVFLIRVKELYESQGITFLNELKYHQWNSATSSHYLNEMENMGSGFNSWAKKFQLEN